MVSAINKGFLSSFLTICLLILLASLLLSSLSFGVFGQDEEVILPGPVFPTITQGQAEVIMSASSGGTTTPPPGTHYYWNNTLIRLTAIPDEGYRFLFWQITGGYIPGHSRAPLYVPDQTVAGEQIYVPPRIEVPSTYDSLVATQNPLNVICGYGYTFEYKAVFISTTPIGSERADAIVVIRESAGGVTDPGAGTYTFTEGQSITLTATPNENQKFEHWIASGTGVTGDEGTTIIPDNPLTVDCGIGYSYDYTPVFISTETDIGYEGIPLEYLYAIILILAIIAVIGVVAALVYRSKK